MFGQISKKIYGTKNEKDIRRLLPFVAAINALEAEMMALPEAAFAGRTENLKKRHLEKGESLEAILPEAFALVREAARRKLGERHYDVQLMGGIVLNDGKITEMKTGEGKTLSCVTAAYLNALSGKGVHVVTVNDYLAQRDADWMRPVYNLLGVTVGTVLPNMDYEAKRKAYRCDITYGTNNEFGFDYLRDNMARSAEQKVQRGHHYCIIDEIDSILIDEARTPLIISGQADDDTPKFAQVNNLVRYFEEVKKDPATDEYPQEEADCVGDYKAEEKSKRITFTNQGMLKLESLLQSNKIISGSLFDPENFEFTHYMTQAMRAHKMFKRDVDYVVQDGKVEIVDEFTGRVLVGRRYSEGLHQAIEAKERITIARRNRTLATITFQNYFRLYKKISGMTGTAETEAKEFAKIYGVDVVVIPTNRPVARIDSNDLIYFNAEYKYNAIAKEVKERQQKGQPVLVGTVSIEKSELLSKYFLKYGIRHEVLNAKNHQREAMIVAEAGAKGAVTIATNMAGRGTDIKLGGNPDFRARRRVGTDAAPEEYLAAYEEEYAKWKKDYDEVCALGGLYILGTERHESRRIDNQLRGRSGRQGDPGFSRFYLSLDDDLMRLFGGENLKSMIGRLGMADGEPIEHRLISRSIERAQNKVEDRNYEIRKHLLEYDDVLNEQRKVIYGQRDEILTDENLSARILASARELVEMCADEMFSSTDTKAAAFARFCNDMTNRFHLDVESHGLDYGKMKENQLVDAVMEMIEEDIHGKEALVGKAPLNGFIRAVYLNKIDQAWQNHLEDLEALRDAVNLRAYAQKNPLLEYKLEGFDIFDKLIFRIKDDMAQSIVKMKINTENASPAPKKPVADFRASHSDLAQFGGRVPQSSAQPGNSSVTVVRSGAKVGRNDPCPCGSGKKYKNCCGR
ncbi:MAG: preprotein translocase subunit SecA [Spirochaetia bacterium]|nr:preprotein translocase subunit SecA [Spirochaetia bacterium]